MNSKAIADLSLYRFRYAIAYGFLGLLMITLLLLNVTGLPPGLSQAEKDSAITSASINLQFRLPTLGTDSLQFLKSTNMVDLPYHLLQKASLQIWGLSPLGVRLPSLALSGLCALLLFVLLHRLLRPSAAVIMSILVVTSSWFIGIGRSGSPGIMILFWTTVLLLLATLVSQATTNRHLWRALAVVALGLSLYTPYMVFLLLAIILASFAQPHLRYILRYTSQAGISLTLFFLIVLLAPLGFCLWQAPTTPLRLLGIPAALPTLQLFTSHIVSALDMLANPFHIAFADLPEPLISLPVTFLVLIGIMRSVQDWHSVRAHVLLIWLGVLVALIGLDTGGLPSLFVPLLLLTGIGLQELIRYWYRLFPRNPYPRLFGILPLTLLVLCIVQFNYQRYFLALPYAPETVSLYDNDAFLLTTALTSKQYRNQQIVVVVPTAQISLYAIDKQVAPNMQIITDTQIQFPDTIGVAVVANASQALFAQQQSLFTQQTTPYLLVNDHQNDSLRFWIYTR